MRQYMVCVCDRLHSRGHKCNSCFRDADAVPMLRGVNTSRNEQVNSRLRHIHASTRAMSAENFMFWTMVHMCRMGDDDDARRRLCKSVARDAGLGVAPLGPAAEGLGAAVVPEAAPAGAALADVDMGGADGLPVVVAELCCMWFVGSAGAVPAACARTGDLVHCKATGCDLAFHRACAERRAHDDTQYKASELGPEAEDGCFCSRRCRLQHVAEAVTAHELPLTGARFAAVSVCARDDWWALGTAALRRC